MMLVARNCVHAFEFGEVICILLPIHFPQTWCIIGFAVLYYYYLVHTAGFLLNGPVI